MLYTKEEITKEVQENKTWILAHDYPTDVSIELAQNAVPVWHDDILMTWRFLPRDDQDTHLDSGLENQTIFTLMAIDLESYYQSLYYEAIDKLVREREEQQVHYVSVEEVFGI